MVPTGTTYLPPNQTGTNQWPATGSPYPAGTPTSGTLAGNSSAILSTFHTSTAATYTSPAGNGSQYSFSSNNWLPADYYQVVLPTTGYTSLSVSWDQARSSTGPAAFKLQMSTNGTSFTDLTPTPYTVLQSGGGGAPGTWSTATYNALYSSTFALPVSADNQASLYVRFTNSESAASAATGSNRIDNISITSVPEPSTVALAAVGLGFSRLLVRRRRSS
ncbi:MAG: PEP-CTERM sorting domain-containing protein [Planctomycetaceae bacterium]